MTPDDVLDIGREAITVAILLSAPLLLSGLIMGVIVGLFQAATSIQEQTMSFIPKLLVVFIALLVTGPWLLQTFIDYAQDHIVNVVPRVIGM